MRAVPVGVSFSDDSSCQRVTGNPAVLAQFEMSAADNLSASAPNADAPGRRVQFFKDGRRIDNTQWPLQRRWPKTGKSRQWNWRSVFPAVSVGLPKPRAHPFAMHRAPLSRDLP